MVSDQGQAMQAANLFDINPTNSSKMKLKTSSTYYYYYSGTFCQQFMKQVRL